MIEFKDWLPQIIGYCEFVTDDVRLRKAWINCDFSETSVTDFDELYEQVFDDLDADRFLTELNAHLPDDQPVRIAIADFLTSLQEIDRIRSKCRELLHVPALLDSEQWQRLRSAALTALDAVNLKADGH